VSRQDIGLALSGGGFRAAAFHLGCLRGLHDLRLLPRVRVISGVSGGALLGALYAYGPAEFNAFDATATALLRGGLQAKLAKRALLSRRAPESLAGMLTLPLAAARRVLTGGRNEEPARVRRVNRTVALADVLAAKVLGPVAMPQVTHVGMDVVLTACDLYTGAAVRYGSAVSSCSRLGDILESVPVAHAVAASAAFPALLPALEHRHRFRDRGGREFEQVLLLTDGGVYDNLGLTVLERGRDPGFTSHVYDLSYVVACDAGVGRLAARAPHAWPSRMKRVVEIMHGRAQHGGRGTLYAAAAEGTLDGFVYAYLGMQDGNLPVTVADLVPRSAVATYPTDFRAMGVEELTALSTRGEQLTRSLIAHYCPQLMT
jgi:NTE family protein